MNVRYYLSALGSRPESNRGEESPDTAVERRRMVAGNARPPQGERCEQRRRRRKARAPKGVASWKHGGATAKFLPLCKAVSSRNFQLKLLLEEPLEVNGDIHPRYMAAIIMT